MDQTIVKASSGRSLGSRSSRRLRAAGQLPGVIYGMGQDPVTVTVDYAELRDALKTGMGLNTVIQLDIEGATESVLVRDVQRDPIKRTVIHADFLRVSPHHKIKLKVPIHTMGDASAVTSEGAMIEQKMFELEVEVAPDSIPEALNADLGLLRLDRGISVADLDLPEGVTTRTPGDISVVTPVVSRAAKMALAEASQAAGADDSDSSAE